MVCGKRLKPKYRLVKITKGVYVNSKFEETSFFGLAHEKCFKSSVDCPEFVLEELKRESGSQGTPP
jgi:hypothetical protein